MPARRSSRCSPTARASCASTTASTSARCSRRTARCRSRRTSAFDGSDDSQARGRTLSDRVRARSGQRRGADRVAALHARACSKRLRARGIMLAPLVLDVGIGTFRPMSGATIDEHVMHRRALRDPGRDRRGDRRRAARGPAGDRRRARRCCARSKAPRCATGSFVAGEARDRSVRHAGLPVPRRRRAADQLPSAALDAARCWSPRSRGTAAYGSAYREAIADRYRFFSFGDAMFVARVSPGRSGRTARVTDS